MNKFPEISFESLENQAQSGERMILGFVYDCTQISPLWNNDMSATTAVSVLQTDPKILNVLEKLLVVNPCRNQMLFLVDVLA